MLHTIIKTAVSTVLLTASMSSFSGELTASKEMTINASPETTWKMIGNFNHLDVWHPLITASELTSGKSNVVGAIRLLTLGNGATITEKLVANNDAARTYSYAITESPLPVTDYVGTISVTAGMEGKSIVTWSSTFDAKGMTNDEAIDSTLGIYAAGLTNLSNHFNK